MKKTIL